MKREALNEAEINDDRSHKQQARDIAILAIAVFIAAIYLAREFYTPNQNVPTTFSPSAEQTVFEIEYHTGLSRVYVSQKQESEVKSGPKIIISKDGNVDIGLMSGEKHLIFSIPLDINKATAQDFEALPGIGPNLARRIIETREMLGGFKTIDDLKKVKGMGSKKWDKLKTLITCK